ncbi:FAD-dependent oxidoreductase [Mycoplasmatota bacterium]|nr:FAD-dependent oxidoreductase [Mycoplasmatota bacterium]
MKTVELAIVGAGPAGLCAAISAASMGSNVVIIDRCKDIGGQLIKQTHMFFGSEKQYASRRGIDIPNILLDELKQYEEKIEIITDATVLAIYEDKVMTILQGENYFKIKPEAIIVATGASERVLAFPNNDLPGIYGAGAVQTLMNVYGVKPGDRVVMVGAGNIGLIVSYQMIQAGVEIVAVLDAAPTIGGYLVHASKLARLDVPILTGHSIKEATGTESLEKIIAWKLDEKWQGIEGTEIELEVDVACISVGLTPLSELLSQAGCEMKYVPELGGVVPLIDQNLETTVNNIFVAGDVSGIEEASSAMVEGYIAGLYAGKKLGYSLLDFDELVDDYKMQLNDLRSGHHGDRIRNGINKIMRGEEKC